MQAFQTNKSGYIIKEHYKWRMSSVIILRFSKIKKTEQNSEKIIGGLFFQDY